MRTKAVLWTIGLLLLALLVGWLLPILAFPTREDGVEEAAVAVEIRSVDLSYESDLDVVDRMRLILEPYSSTLTLERGVYLQQEEVYSVLDAFLYDLTGRSFSISEQTCYVRPVLLGIEGSGAFVVWMTQAELDSGWELRAVVDDQSGVVLQCTLDARTGDWESLFPQMTSEGDALRYIQNRFCSAFQSQLRRRLSEDWKVEVEALMFDAQQDASILRILEAGRERHNVILTLLLGENAVFLNE